MVTLVAGRRNLTNSASMPSARGQVKLAGDGDEVVAALPVSCGNGEALLSLSEKSWKVIDVADVPIKGPGTDALPTDN